MFPFAIIRIRLLDGLFKGKKTQHDLKSINRNNTDVGVVDNYRFNEKVVYNLILTHL